MDWRMWSWAWSWNLVVVDFGADAMRLDCSDLTCLPWSSCLLSTLAGLAGAWLVEVRVDGKRLCNPSPMRCVHLCAAPVQEEIDCLKWNCSPAIYVIGLSNTM